MIAGKGTPDQGPAHALKAENRALFEAIIDRLTEGTIEYLSRQIEAGAEVVKLFDSWAGSLEGDDFQKYSIAPMAKITAALQARHPGRADHRLPARGGRALRRAARGHRGPTASRWTTGSTPPRLPLWSSGTAAFRATSPPRIWSRVATRLSPRPAASWRPSRAGRIFLTSGHGITPDADPENVQLMIDTVRGG